MPATSGVIDKIYIDELEEADDYGGKYRRAFVVDGERYGLSNGKQPS